MQAPRSLNEPKSNHYQSVLIKQHPLYPARIMQMTTPHGQFLTPSFMPVGTRAMLNYVSSEDLIRSQSHIILGGNTYHMLVTPGLDVIESIGGMHRFMGWERTMLTDSGGFQVFSLAKGGSICMVDDEGAHFKHPVTGKVIHLNAQSSIDAQKVIGADIVMAFDECTPETGGRTAAEKALKRTHDWLALSKEHHDRNPFSKYGSKQALFGIIQGGSFRDLREKSTEFILSQDLDGIGIGGEVIGFDMPKTLEIIDWIRPQLPKNKVRYTMGVGLSPEDLIEAAKKGIDLFDCVAPTRNARHGTLYCGEIVKENHWIAFKNENAPTRIHIKKSQYTKDEKPIMPDCGCYTCCHYSRAYLHYLFKEKLIAYSHLASIHNIHVMQKVCLKMQEFIYVYAESRMI